MERRHRLFNGILCIRQGLIPHHKAVHKEPMLLSLIYVMNCKDGDVRCDINQRGGLYFAGGTFTAEEEIRCFEITHYIKKMEVTQQGE
jgi:hypothetical protein